MNKRHLRRRLFSRHNLRKLLLPITILLLILIFVFASRRFRVFSISAYRCRIAGNPCTAIDHNQIEAFLGHSLFTFKPEELRSRLIQNPLYKDARVRLVFPNTLEVDIAPEIDLFPLGLIRFTPPTELSSATAASAPAELIDSDLPFQAQAVSQKPFSVTSLTRRGDLVENDSPARYFVLVESDLPDKDTLAAYYAYLKDISLSGLNLQPVWLYRRQLVARYQDVYILFSLDSSSYTSLASLQQILSQSTMKMNHSVIDLRFALPLIRPLNQESR